MLGCSSMLIFDYKGWDACILGGHEFGETMSSAKISFHLIPSHFISFPVSCHVPSGDEMDQYLKVDQWKKKSEKNEEEKESEKNEEEKESEKKEEEKKEEE